jgi:hypothetical protein
VGYASGGALMPHLLVPQLRFTRSEFQRALDGVSDNTLPIRRLALQSGVPATLRIAYIMVPKLQVEGVTSSVTDVVSHCPRPAGVSQLV